MTIIKSSEYLTNYPLQALDDALASQMLRTSTDVDEVKGVALRLFDCHCHCLDESLELHRLETAKIQWLLKSFLGSLSTGGLVSFDEQYVRRLSRAAIGMVGGLKPLLPGFVPITWASKAFGQFHGAWEASKRQLNPETVSFWGGWMIKAQNGKPVYLCLAGMYKSHGPAFTKAFHEAMRRDVLKRRKAQSNMINRLANFIAGNAHRFPKEVFQDPDLMEEFAEAYFWEYQSSEYERNEDPRLNARTWRTMRLIIVRALLKPAVWKADEEAFVIPAGQSTPGSDRNIKKNKHGIEIKDKLLTEIPLYVTDIEAIDLLYGEVRRDLHTVEKYALSQALQIRKAQRRRIREAPLGSILEVKDRKSRAYNDFNKTGLRNIYHTFEAEGMSTTVEARIRYGERLPELALLLGMPTTYSLFPFQCLLTMYHPEITAAFLENLAIWDGNKRVSFIKTNKGYELTGYKDRRESKHSEQKILLLPKAAALVRMVEQITKPLRQYLKKQNDPNWQKLFLTSGSSFNYPIPASTNILSCNRIESSKSVREMMLSQLAPHSDKQGDELVDFLKKLCLSRVRAQAAVADYIKNHSLPRLAKKLGHANYNKDLLDSYLPAAIYDFFATRYVRIFQKGIICEAMEGSRHFLRATKLESFEKLHEFLSRYALKEIPENLRSMTDNKIPDGEIVEVGVSVSAASMTALLSVREAVRRSKTPDRIRGLAKYWAAVCDKIESFILNGHNKKLHKYLATAQENHNSSLYEGMIYAVS